MLLLPRFLKNAQQSHALLTSSYSPAIYLSPVCPSHARLIKFYLAQHTAAKHIYLHYLKHTSVIWDTYTALANMTRKAEWQLQARLATKGDLKWHCTHPTVSGIPPLFSSPNPTVWRGWRQSTLLTPPLLPQPAALLPVKHWWEILLLNKWDDWALGKHLVVGMVQGDHWCWQLLLREGTLGEMSRVLLSILQSGKEAPQKQVSNTWNPLVLKRSGHRLKDSTFHLDQNSRSPMKLDNSTMDFSTGSMKH